MIAPTPARNIAVIGAIGASALSAEREARALMRQLLHLDPVQTLPA